MGNATTTFLNTDIFLEAECGTIGGTWSSLSDDNASNDEYVVVPTSDNTAHASPTNAADWVRLTFDVNTAGNYKVFARYKGPNGSDDSYYIRANGSNWARVNSTSSSWNWQQVQDGGNGNANILYALSVGTNTIDIGLREDGTQIDKLFVTLNGSLPSGEGGAAVNCGAGSSVENCSNGIDDDGDSDIDCDDADCNCGTLPCAGRVSTGLLAYYNFTEGSGSTVYDQSAYGTPLNLTIQNPSNTTWENGCGLTINSNTRIESSTAATKINNAIISSNALTIEAWVDPANETQGSRKRIVTLSQDGLNRNASLFQDYDHYVIRNRTTTTDVNGNPTQATPSESVHPTGPQHVVYTWNGSNGQERIYVDGEIQYSGTRSGNTSNWTSAYKLALGGELSGSDYWLGTLYQVAIYNKALTQAEVLQNIDQGHCCANTPVNPYIGCDEDRRVDIYFTGLKNNVPATVNIPSSGNVDSVRVEIIYDDNNPGASITVQGSNGVNYTANAFEFASNDYRYTAHIPTGVSSVTYSNQAYENKAQSMVVFAYRSGVSNPQMGVEFTLDERIYHEVFVEQIPIPVGSQPRDIRIKIPVSEISTDGRQITIKAAAGSVSQSITRSYNSDSQLPEGCCIDIFELDLQNVAPNVTTLKLYLISPDVNGQSYFVSGKSGIDIDCTCPDFDIDISTSVTEACLGETVVFSTPLISSLTGETYTWDFGNNASPATATGAGPHSVTYSSSGTKTVSLQVSNPICDETKTMNIFIVRNHTQGGNISGNESSCGGFDPSLITNTNNPSGGSGGGTAEYRWQYREDPENDGTYTAWSNISGADALTYDPPFIAVTTQYRRSVRLSPCASWINSSIVTKEVFSDGTDLVVNSAGDTDDANPGDGTCSDINCECTLRAAIQEANARAGADVITFDIPLADPRYFNPDGTNNNGDEYFNIQLLLGDLPTITEAVTIDGLTQPNASCNASFLPMDASIGGEKPVGMLILVNANQVSGLTTYWRSTVEDVLLRGLAMLNFTITQTGGTYGLSPQGNTSSLEMECSIICTDN